MRIRHDSDTLGSTGRKNSTTSIGCHGHAGDTRSGQTHKTPEDLCTYVIEEGGDGEGAGSEASSLLSYTLGYVNLVELGHVGQFGFREPMDLCPSVSEPQRGGWGREGYGIRSAISVVIHT
jgi:hypothetical protein